MYLYIRIMISLLIMEFSVNVKDNTPFSPILEGGDNKHVPMSLSRTDEILLLLACGDVQRSNSWKNAGLLEFQSQF